MWCWVSRVNSPHWLGWLAKTGQWGRGVTLSQCCARLDLWRKLIRDPNADAIKGFAETAVLWQVKFFSSLREGLVLKRRNLIIPSRRLLPVSRESWFYLNFEEVKSSFDAKQFWIILLWFSDRYIQDCVEYGIWGNMFSEGGLIFRNVTLKSCYYLKDETRYMSPHNTKD